jgi:hypothetical protein
MEQEKKVVYVNKEDDELSNDELIDGGVNDDEKKSEYEIPVSVKNSDDEDSMSESVSDIGTSEILKIDPMYLRLTKFFQSNNGESVGETLQTISKQLENLNANLSKFIDNNSK